MKGTDMRTMLRLRCVRWIAWMIVVQFGLPYMGGAVLAATSKEMLRQTAVIFPVGNMETDSPSAAKAARAADHLTALLQRGFAGYPRYLTVNYSERLPSVQKIASMDPDGKKLVAGPFAGDPDAMKRALAIAKATSADVAITSTLDFYKFDAGKSEVAITATVHVVDVKSAKSYDTTVTGRASRPTGDDTAEGVLAEDAVRDAGMKLMEQITGGQYDSAQQQPVVVASAEKRSKKNWLPMLLLSLGVGLLVSSSGGSSDSGTPGGADPPPNPPGF